MTQAPRIVYRARKDATSEAEVAALMAVYKFVLDCVNRDAAGETSTNGDDANERFRNDSSVRQKYTE